MNSSLTAEEVAEASNGLISIHMSLYQHVLATDDLRKQTNKVQRWLRVGYVVEQNNKSNGDAAADNDCA